MAISFTENIFKTRYKDDFADSAGYHRILFNPRKALQARELTQMQTIIQREVERFGKNIFKEGASVSSGGMVINSNYEFVKIQGAFPNGTIVGETFTHSSGIQVRVLETVAASGSDPNTLYVRYTNSIGGTSGTTPIRLPAGEQIAADNSDATMTVQATNTSSNPAVGAGVRISTGQGDFFVQGFFVYAPAQNLIISKYSRDHTTTIGFNVVQEIVTVDDDNSLYDNQGVLPNTTAPGADRFRIKLILATQDSITAGDTFVPIGKIKNSRIIEIANGQNQYNKINDILAQRTREESGNYIIKPFSISYDSADASNLTLTVSEGTAYVNGYRVNNPTPSFITVPRATDTVGFNNQSIGVEYGNYVVASSIKGAPDINNLTKVNISTSATNSGGTIGTCRIRSVEYVAASAEYRIYIFDVQMAGSNKFRDARSIGTGTTNHVVLKTKTNTNGVIVGEIQEANKEGLFFSLPSIRPKELQDITVVVQRKVTGTATSSGQLQINLQAVNEKWSDTNNWLVFSDSDGSTVTPTGTITGSGTDQATIECGSALANKSISVIGYVSKTNATVKSKSITTHTISNGQLTTDSDGFGNSFKFLDLDATDVIEINSVLLNNTAQTDVAHYFELDNGQRDAYYDQGRLILKSNFTDPTAGSDRLNVSLKHYTHSTTGDFFSINSYSSTNYAKIPTHTAENGFEINLRDVLDFRPVKDQSGEFTGAGARKIGLPKNTDTVTLDATYYQPRNDKVVINETADIKVITGSSSLTPTFADTPANSLELFRTKMGANTLSGGDVSYDMVEAKGYTMTEIGKIEKRVEKLEELTNLSLLELDTSKFSVQDSNGNDRIKSGFIVDNFIDHFYSAVDNNQYAASVDPKDHTLHPSFVENNIGLVYDSAQNSGMMRKGDNVYLDYKDSTYISQLETSKTLDINSFDAFQFNGNISLSPASDELRDVEKIGQKAIVGGQKLSFKQSTLFNNWEWNWFGTDANGNDIAQEEDQSERYIQPDTRSFSDRTGGYLTRGMENVERTIVNRVVSSETIRKIVDDKIVDVAIIPFMRSRIVHFDAVGLRPNTRVFPYFDNVDVSAWCREDTAKFYGEGLDSDYSNLQAYNTTGHPDGSTNLVTDGEGKVSGTFFIPNTASLSFRSGVREFKLLDITTSTEADASTKAAALYNASGVIEKNHNGIVSTRHITINGSDKNILADRVISSNDTRGRIDPLAQSFFIENEQGAFINSVDLFFKSKDADLPVWIQVVPIVNGSPSREVIVPGSVKYLSPSSVNVSETGATQTKFEFNEPIYLKGFTEYALTIQSDSKAYKLWAGQTGDIKVGSQQERVTKQTTVGPLYTPQNSFKWEPQFDVDLKFKINRCKFVTGNNFTATLKTRAVPKRLLPANPFSVTLNSNVVEVNHPNHGLVKTDRIHISGATAVGGITINGVYEIVTDPDGDTYQIDGGSNSTETAIGGGINACAETNYQYDIINPYIETLLPEGTSLTSHANQITGKSLAGAEVPYVVQSGPEYRDIILKTNNHLEAPNLIPGARNSSGVKRTEVAKIKLTAGSSNDFVSPVIDLQRASLSLFGNRIDRQVASNPTAGFNKPINFIAETDKSSGSHLSKHVTKPIPLVVDAVGLKILLSANRPPDSEFELYYKTVSEDQTLSTMQWKLANVENPVAADENRDAFREYRYLIGGQNGNMTPFTAFQIKIVFRSKNSSKVPVIKDLRAIALGV